MKFSKLHRLAKAIFFTSLALLIVNCGGSSEPKPADESPGPSNQAPTIVSEFTDLQLSAGLYFTQTLSGRFSDEGSLAYDMIEIEGGSLPSWLWFDPNLLQMQGIAPATATNITLQVNARDEQGLSTSATFALRVTPEPSMLSAQELEQDQNFIQDLLLKESRFIQAGVGFNATTGLSHDGVWLNPADLEPIGKPSYFSAPSKESLHINILAKAILGNPRAKLLITGMGSSTAEAIALEQLRQKISSFEGFESGFPAFGGFLPWFISEDRGQGLKVYPLGGWEDRLPALDNGQFAWSIFLVYKALDKMGHNALAQRYQDYFEKLTLNAKRLFFDSTRQVVSGISRFVGPNGEPDASLPPQQLSYIKDAYALSDPYEGELMVLFMILFAQDLNEAEKQSLWANKVTNTRSYSLSVGDKISVIEGWAFSSHEQWKFLVLPYLDYLPARELYLNGEKARADYSNQHQYRGFFASVNAPSQNYVSLLGIPELASEVGVSNEVLAPYAVFPMILADVVTQNNTGLNWLRNVLAYDKLLGPYGIIESYNTQNFAIAPLLTWDGKVTTNLALMSGVFQETREFMIEDGLYLPFINLLEQAYSSISANIDGSDVNIAEPTSSPIPVDPCENAVPQAGTIQDFDCQSTVPVLGLNIVSNPVSSAQNSSLRVGQYKDPTGPWDALIIDFNEAIALGTNNLFRIKVMAPIEGILKVKLEGGSSAPIELDIYIDQINTWQEYSFDFSSQANKNHQKIALFFNAGLSNAGTDTYYIDDIRLTGP